MKLQKITLLLFTLLTITTFSQTEKGNYYIGASSSSIFNFKKIINGPFSNLNRNYNRRIVISPDFGYFVSNKFLVGLTTYYEFYVEERGNQEQTSNIYTLGSFVKYYFLNNKLKPFLDASYSFGKSKTSNTDNNLNLKESRKNLKLGLGLAYFINNNFSIELAINYEEDIFKRTDFNSSSKVGFINSSIGFGIFL